MSEDKIRKMLQRKVEDEGLVEQVVEGLLHSVVTSGNVKAAEQIFELLNKYNLLPDEPCCANCVGRVENYETNQLEDSAE